MLAMLIKYPNPVHMWFSQIVLKVCFNKSLNQNQNEVAIQFLLKIRSWWECMLVQPLWKKVWRFLRKLKIELPYDPAIALLGIYPRDTGVLFRRDTCIPMFTAALSTIAKVWKEPKCPSMDEWIKKIWCTYIQWSITRQLKRMKSCHLQLCGWNWRVLC